MIGAVLIQIMILFILLMISAFFSASETSLTSLSKIRLRYMVEENIKGAKLVERLTEQPDKLISSILVGNNISNIAGSSLATAIALELFGGNAVAISTTVMTILVLVFAEITPKSLAAQNSEKVSIKVSKPLSLIVNILNPIIIVLNKVTNLLVKILGGKVDENTPYITEDELKSIVNVSHEEGVLEVEEKQMIYNVFEFGDLQIKDVMVQRTDISAIDVNFNLNKILEAIKQDKYSRYPVYENNIDNIIGILNVKDFIYSDYQEDNFNIIEYTRQPHFTYEFKRITELFKEMKKNRDHIAIILDEYGGTAGIATIEDLIEEIVGEIEDEYDEVEKEIEKIGEREYIVNGSTRIVFINGFFGFNIKSDDFDSIGGFITGQMGRLPKVGEVIVYENVRFIVKSVLKHRIQKVKIEILL